jgi:hypothetical protein
MVRVVARPAGVSILQNRELFEATLGPIKVCSWAQAIIALRVSAAANRVFARSGIGC